MCAFVRECGSSGGGEVGVVVVVVEAAASVVVVVSAVVVSISYSMIVLIRYKRTQYNSKRIQDKSILKKVSERS